MAELTSDSLAGKLVQRHEIGDTWIRTFTISSNAVLVDFTGATIKIYITSKEDAETKIATLVDGDGLAVSDLANGEIKTFWQTNDGLLKPRKTYYYKLEVTFPDGRIKTYVEDKFETA